MAYQSTLSNDTEILLEPLNDSNEIQITSNNTDLVFENDSVTTNTCYQRIVIPLIVMIILFVVSLLFIWEGLLFFEYS